MYLSEIAPPSLKGSFGLLTQLFVVFGMLLAQSISFPWAKPMLWRYVLLVSLGMGVIQLVGSFFVDSTVKAERKSRGDEEMPLLEGGCAREEHRADQTGQQATLSLMDLFASKDPAIRRGREYHP